MAREPTPSYAAADAARAIDKTLLQQGNSMMESGRRNHQALRFAGIGNQPSNYRMP